MLKLKKKLFQSSWCFQDFPLAESFQNRKGEYWPTFIGIYGPDGQGFVKILPYTSERSIMRELRHQIKGASPICPNGVKSADIWKRERPTAKSPHCYSRVASYIVQQ